MTDAGDELCWWQFKDFGDGFGHFGYQDRNSITNIYTSSRTSRCHQNHCHRDVHENIMKLVIDVGHRFDMLETFFLDNLTSKLISNIHYNMVTSMLETKCICDSSKILVTVLTILVTNCWSPASTFFWIRVKQKHSKDVTKIETLSSASKSSHQLQVDYITMSPTSLSRWIFMQSLLNDYSAMSWIRIKWYHTIDLIQKPHMI